MGNPGLFFIIFILFKHQFNFYCRYLNVKYDTSITYLALGFQLTTSRSLNEHFLPDMPYFSLCYALYWLCLWSKKAIGFFIPRFHRHRSSAVDSGTGLRPFGPPTWVWLQADRWARRWPPDLGLQRLGRRWTAFWRPTSRSRWGMSQMSLLLFPPNINSTMSFL